MHKLEILTPKQVIKSSTWWIFRYAMVLWHSYESHSPFIDNQSYVLPIKDWYFPVGYVTVNYQRVSRQYLKMCAEDILLNPK